MKVGGRRTSPHRVAYALAYGPIPDGMFVCHRCDVPICINPAHLFLGTHDENMADMVAKKRRQLLRANGSPRPSRSGVPSPSKRTHCPQGHPYSSENTLIVNGCRNCAICKRASAKRRRNKVKAEKG